MQAWRGGAGHLIEGTVDHIGQPRKFGRAERLGLRSHALEFICRHVSKHASGNFLRGGTHHDEIAHAFEQIFHEASRVLAGLDDPVDCHKRRCSVSRTECIDDITEYRARRVAEQGNRAVVAHEVALGAGDELV